MKKTVAILAGSLTMLSASAALAEGAQKRVRYDDLNLVREEGVSKLDRRLKAAAHEVCGAHDLRDLRAQMHSRRCHKAAIASADTSRQIAIRSARESQKLASK